jgi:transcriptional regulator with XRE-family HTH domain
MVCVTVHGDGSMATHFGRQIHKERLAHGWTLRELAARSGVDFSHLSRIESGKRPPTEAIADAMDRVFPGRRGWFREFYDDAKSAMPPGLRSWTEIEDRAARLAVWCPGTIHGLLQTEAYARVLLSTLASVPAEVVDARLAARAARQQRVLRRADPPAVVAIIDHPALYRGVGSPSVMAAQMRHLLDLARLPNVTLQVLPPVAHPATASELIIADDAAAYAEHLAAGGVYTDPETVARLGVIMATIRGECYRASDSAATIGKAGRQWTGASQVSAGRTDHVSRQPRTTA